LQFEGGYKYPSGWIAIVLSLISLFIAIIFLGHCKYSIRKIISLFLNLEGTVLLASSFAPTGFIPPPAGIISKFKWFFEQGAKGVPLKYNQILFYGGLLCLFIASIISF